MKRRVRNLIRDALNDVVHGRKTETINSIGETGTSVLVKRVNYHRFTMDIILRGDDRVEV